MNSSVRCARSGLPSELASIHVSGGLLEVTAERKSEYMHGEIQSIDYLRVLIPKLIKYPWTMQRELV
jgi:hypothetical protein